jgi:hypothetical protein
MDAGQRFNYEKDSLHLLPLSIIPLNSPSLSRARLVKNVRMQSMVELFQGAGTGSGQIDPGTVDEIFDISQDTPINDADTIIALAKLGSFDVYSLRIQLRGLGINVEDSEHLRLSPDKRAELIKYMLSFTRPLIRQIYGNNDTDIADLTQLIQLFDNPDREEAMNNLRTITENLHITIAELPRFLKDYGDTFLSLAYFQNCLDALEPHFVSFADAVKEIREHHQLKQNSTLMYAMAKISANLDEVKVTVEALLESFEKESESMWEDINADTFHRVKMLIEYNHTTIGGMLCGLSVKLGGWAERFGRGDHGVLRQAEFIMSEMRHGMEELLALKAVAPPSVGFANKSVSAAN